MQALCQCMSFRREFHTVYLYIGCCDMLAVRLHTILVNGSAVWANTIGLGLNSFVLQYVVVVCVVNTIRKKEHLFCRYVVRHIVLLQLTIFYFTNKINSGAERACSCFKHLKACVRSHIIPICASMKHDMTVGRKRHKHALGCT